MTYCLYCGERYLTIGNFTSVTSTFCTNCGGYKEYGQYKRAYNTQSKPEPKIVNSTPTPTSTPTKIVHISHHNEKYNEKKF